jgi:FMN-dependent NADH-azoreductase
MGIVRQTVLYLGRPIYQGDSREGLVVYNAMDESVEKVKLVIKNFITAYDENNEPSGFVDLQLYFKRIPLIKERLKAAVLVRADT